MIAAVPVENTTPVSVSRGNQPSNAADVTATVAAIPWLTVLCSAYLIGLLIVAGARLRSYWCFAASLRGLHEADPEIESLVAAFCRQNGVRRAVRVRISDAVPSPAGG